jgi:hypothetical protein
VLLIAGLQLPVIPLLDVVGKLNDPPVQIAGTCVKDGTTGLFTVTVIVAIVVHPLLFGVKV